MWIGDCYPNGSLTKHGWTHENFKAHLAFLDTVGIQRIGASLLPYLLGFVHQLSCTDLSSQ